MTARKCTICGCEYTDTFCFKNGFVCESCLAYLKDDFQLETKD